jgi:hypothetical protein
VSSNILHGDYTLYQGGVPVVDAGDGAFVSALAFDAGAGGVMAVVVAGGAVFVFAWVLS